MFFAILAFLLISVTVWTNAKLIRQDLAGVVLFLSLAVFVFLIYMFIVYMRLFYGLQLSGIYRVFGGIISNCFLPLCYLTVCQMCHIRKNTLTAKCLFGFTLLNVFSMMTIYTDATPISDYVFNDKVNIYNDGKFWSSLTIYELVEVIQLIWLSERIGRFYYKIKRDNLQFTKTAKVGMVLIFITFMLMITYRLIPDYVWRDVYVGYLSQTIDFLMIIAIIIGIGWGNKLLFITDSNNEIVFFNDLPNPVKMKRKLEKLIASEKIHRNIVVTIGGVAHVLDTNSSYLADFVQKEYGMTFTAFITNARIEDAKNKMLRKPDMPMADVAKACGFNSAVNFSKAFRKVTGMTPSEWSDSQKRR